MIHLNERFIAGIRSQAMLAVNQEQLHAWLKYRAIIARRQITSQIDHSIEIKMVNEGLPSRAVAPYEYAPEALRKVYAHLSAK